MGRRSFGEVSQRESEKRGECWHRALDHVCARVCTGRGAGLRVDEKCPEERITHGCLTNEQVQVGARWAGGSAVIRGRWGEGSALGQVGGTWDQVWGRISRGSPLLIANFLSDREGSPAEEKGPIDIPGR